MAAAANTGWRLRRNSGKAEKGYKIPAAIGIKIKL
jgi:hypothetical protein